MQQTENSRKDTATATATATAARQDWMSVLAKAPADDVIGAWEALADKPRYRLLRAPETGLVMVQARAGGSGGKFNFGEMTVTRCVVELGKGGTGHAYVAGSDTEHAEIAAAFDALLQHEGSRGPIVENVIEPLRAAQAERRRVTEAKSAATRVDFFTLVRGDSE
ncbi:MAG: phosphonate C-P lyase system protein PhnG [Rhodospirillaceae bacterium]